MNSDKRLQIDIAVHGRFHAFHLARALIAAGHDVRVHTNYPKFAVAKFGIPRSRVRSLLWHAVVGRVYYRVRSRLGLSDWEPWLHRAFGRWAARIVRRDSDAVYLFSGIAEEALDRLSDNFAGLRLVVRASAHIREQRRILLEEEARCAIAVDKPAPWIVDREVREYEKADRIVVLSSFARESFVREGVDEDKVWLMLSGVDARRFASTKEALAARLARIRAGEPLRVLTVGSFTPRKGALDLIRVAQALRGKMQFRFVGDLPHESKSLIREANGLIEFVDRLPEFELPAQYTWGDVFFFPTIEDGYPAVLAQALTACLPALTTPNCSAPDIVRPGRNGWIVPIRDVDRFVSVLQWCDSERESLATMAASMANQAIARHWDKVAASLVYLVMGAKNAGARGVS
jgi:glycosyltransferase involved in cell wall biosynthesis